jgi:hypothetical protein
MNNVNIEQLLNDTTAEFASIDVLVQQVGAMSPLCKYLTHYCLIKACGVIEYSYKSIVADFHNGCSAQLQSYIDKTVRDSSKNPTLDNMHKLLKSFDDNWNKKFSSSLSSRPDLNRITASLGSLNSNRNAIAHGQNCIVSFGDVRQYYNDSVEIIKLLDAAVV